VKQKIALLSFPPKNDKQSAVETTRAHLLRERPSGGKGESDCKKRIVVS